MGFFLRRFWRDASDSSYEESSFLRESDVEVVLELEELESSSAEELDESSLEDEELSFLVLSLAWLLPTIAEQDGIIMETAMMTANTMITMLVTRFLRSALTCAGVFFLEAGRESFSPVAESSVGLTFARARRLLLCFPELDIERTLSTTTPQGAGETNQRPWADVIAHSTETNDCSVCERRELRR